MAHQSTVLQEERQWSHRPSDHLIFRSSPLASKPQYVQIMSRGFLLTVLSLGCTCSLLVMQLAFAQKATPSTISGTETFLFSLIVESRMMFTVAFGATKAIFEHSSSVRKRFSTLTRSFLLYLVLLRFCPTITTLPSMRPSILAIMIPFPAGR